MVPRRPDAKTFEQRARERVEVLRTGVTRQIADVCTTRHGRRRITVGDLLSTYREDVRAGTNCRVLVMQ